jgi:hypothetical protein
VCDLGDELTNWVEGIAWQWLVLAGVALAGAVGGLVTLLLSKRTPQPEATRVDSEPQATWPVPDPNNVFSLRDAIAPFFNMRDAITSRMQIQLQQPMLKLTQSWPIRARSTDRSGASGVTVGIFQRRAEGIDPVTGWIVCVKGVNMGRDYRLHSDRNMIGRAPTMDICIEGDDAISREDHCQIAFSPRSMKFTLIPGTGRNLIYLNGEDVFEATALKPYDEIDIGESSFLFVPFCGEEFMWE